NVPPDDSIGQLNDDTPHLAPKLRIPQWRLCRHRQQATLPRPSILENLRTNYTWQRAVVALSATVIGVVVVGTLYWAQMVFMPLGMAFFLAFLLEPPVSALQRRGFGRLPSVIAAVLVLALSLTTIGWLLGQQTADLV